LQITIFEAHCGEIKEFIRMENALLPSIYWTLAKYEIFPSSTVHVDRAALSGFRGEGGEICLNESQTAGWFE
jgi:hypothetical protein